METEKKETIRIIHVRFNTDGTVREIGDRPASMTAQEWFNTLSRGTFGAYTATTGGRGYFMLSPEVIGELSKTA